MTLGVRGMLLINLACVAAMVLWTLFFSTQGTNWLSLVGDESDAIGVFNDVDNDVWCYYLRGYGRTVTCFHNGQKF